jgi:alkaline phosphatase D
MNSSRLAAARGQFARRRRRWWIKLCAVQPISRRRLLAAGAAVAIAPRVRRSVSASALDGDPFTLGVCSGDPDGSSAVLWTRLTSPDGSPLGAPDVALTWELSDDEDFRSTLASGDVLARADEAHSIHVVAELAGTAFFRFRSGEWVSPVGRTAPLPAPAGGSASRLRIATPNCQHFEDGFYAAHRDIAEWRPDLVLFLGDFIYENAGNPVGDGIVRSHQGGETVGLDEYRARYAQYLGDAQLQASRAACPWLVVWDDHEADNNYAGLIPEDPAQADTFPARRLAAYQAWWEHQPVRMARPTSIDDFTIYRSFTWGSLAKVVMLDGRQHRSDQACGDVTLNFDPACPEASEPDRTMLGREQERWLLDELGTVDATWAVIGQQTVVSDLGLPNGAILNYDQWDGYELARRRLLLAAAQTDRTIVLTGDIHLASVGVLPGLGVEFVSTSITSTGLDAGLEDALAGLFPNVKAVELAHRGYTRHVVSPEQWTAEFRVVDDVTDPDSAVSTWKTFTIDAGARDVVTEVSV